MCEIFVAVFVVFVKRRFARFASYSVFCMFVCVCVFVFIGVVVVIVMMLFVLYVCVCDDV